MAVTLEMISYDILSWRVCRSFASRSAFWDTDVTSVKHVMMWYSWEIMRHWKEYYIVSPILTSYSNRQGALTRASISKVA